MDEDKLKVLIAEISQRQLELDKLMFDEPLPHEMAPPATSGNINRLRRLLGADIPADYRQFLEHHDGWSDFDGDGKLLATTDHWEEWVKERVAEWGSIWDPDEDNPFASGALPVLLGPTKNSFLVIDPRRRNDADECVFVMYDFMVEEEMFSTFASYLERRLSILEALIDRQTNGEPDPDTAVQ